MGKCGKYENVITGAGAGCTTGAALIAQGHAKKMPAHCTGIAVISIKPQLSGFRFLYFLFLEGEFDL